MTVWFDADSGRLRLTREAWAALLEWDPAAMPASRAEHELHKSGLIVEGRLAPRVEWALLTVREPVLTITATQRDHRGIRADGCGWVSTGSAALLIDSSDGLCELIVTESTLISAVLARIVELGPRGRATDSTVAMSLEMFSLLTDASADFRRRAVAEVGVGALEPLTGGPWNLWCVRTSQRNDVREVLDTPDQLWVVKRDDTQVRLEPSDPSHTWRWLAQCVAGVVGSPN